jgi:hypothetical protein
MTDYQAENKAPSFCTYPHQCGFKSQRIAELEALLRDVIGEDDKFDVCITERLRDRIGEALR